MNCEIRHHEYGACYTLLVDGRFEGNFETVSEAAREFDRIKMEEESQMNQEAYAQ